jgi:3-methylfumaryl-CoA hydratase
VATDNSSRLQEWVGRSQSDRDVAATRQANLMAATIDREDRFADGDPLPALWHWLYFHEGLPASQLGKDGHAARGGFLPPVQLRNRLWAGGRLQFDADIPLGATIDRRSEVLRVVHKEGANGGLVFVTVLHEISVDGRRCVREEHDIAYRNPVAPETKPTAAAAVEPAPGGVCWTPDIIQLFRYSALTFNSNRVHYDVEYCRDVEGYKNIVVHGPLTATMLAGVASKAADGRLRNFEYRARKPALLGDTLVLSSQVDGRRVKVWSSLPTGEITLEAHGEW